MKTKLLIFFLSLVSTSILFAADLTAVVITPSINAVYLPGDHFAKTTIAAGNTVYVDSSIVGASQSPTNPDIGLASAGGTGDAVKVVGLAAGGAATGQPLKIIIRDPGLVISASATPAAGDILFLGNGNGAVTITAADVQASGKFVCVLAIGKASGVLNFGATFGPPGLGFLGLMRADVAHP